MRAILMVGRAMLAGILLGGMFMVATEVDAGQEKKDEKLPDRITLTKWDIQSKVFHKPITDVHAKRREVKGVARFDVTIKIPGNNVIYPGSEIIDQADKSVWIVTETTTPMGGTTHLVICKKKEEAKKD